MQAVAVNGILQLRNSIRAVCGEFQQCGKQIDIEPSTEETVLNARHGYYANTSYFDDWVGQFIDALKRTELFDRTIVIVTSDHGDMLGAVSYTHLTLPTKRIV